jgi:hypothetical protein
VPLLQLQPGTKLYNIDESNFNTAQYITRSDAYDQNKYNNTSSSAPALSAPRTLHSGACSEASGCWRSALFNIDLAIIQNINGGFNALIYGSAPSTDSTGNSASGIGHRSARLLIRHRAHS